MGQQESTGEIFEREDLQKLIQQGHELACHTFDHCDSWQTTPAEFEASILKNRRAAAQVRANSNTQDFLVPDYVAAPSYQTADRSIFRLRTRRRPDF